MRIGELSRRTGVSTRLLRYYEEQGLLDAERLPNGYRSYGDGAVATVHQIRALLAAGLSTQVIKDVLPCARGEVPTLEPCPNLLATLRRELGAIDARMDALRTTRESLSGFLQAAAREAA
ncbi:DNA-binding transcriptional MerR regulator [Nocardiopsis mwathae]|uniref:DNA-binding transcriptional MerR regulator n=1 Tax=Nocardiopsis mwathae TaxID=1472723 RepID=A0A7X0D4X4_9ACTN|nr:MerR family transcriptional regulator [Nocardiopsis mwathae]MBB6171767.1 DNA-binding transcriptional MerR regulator [Nocardiopsis mwathae]